MLGFVTLRQTFDSAPLSVPWADAGACFCAPLSILRSLGSICVPIRCKPLTLLSPLVLIRRDACRFRFISLLETRSVEHMVMAMGVSQLKKRRSSKHCRKNPWIAAEDRQVLIGTARRMEHYIVPINKNIGYRPKADAKGVQNRRFWHVFGYFCRGAKVPGGSGGEKSPGCRAEPSPPRPQGIRSNSPLTTAGTMWYDVPKRGDIHWLSTIGVPS